MFIDHFGLYVFNNNMNYRLIGRLSFPIFATILGYHFKDKIHFKLLFFGLPIAIIYYYINSIIFLNVLYSFFIGEIFLLFYNNLNKNNLDRYVFLLTLFIFAPIFNFVIEYGILAFLFMLSANSKNKQKLYFFIFTFILYYIIQNITFSFNIINQIIFLVLLSIEGYYLYNYNLYNIYIKNNNLNLYIKLLARYSLEIYVLQSMFFKLYSFLSYC